MKKSKKVKVIGNPDRTSDFILEFDKEKNVLNYVDMKTGTLNGKELDEYLGKINMGKIFGKIMNALKETEFEMTDFESIHYCTVRKKRVKVDTSL